MKPHYDVLIATPGKMMHAEYVGALVDTARELSARGISYKFLNRQSSFIPTAREATALDIEKGSNWQTREVGAGQYTYGKIIWIDSDVQWKVSDFITLLDSDLDIVSGVYLTGMEGFLAASKFDPKGRPAMMHQNDLFMEDEPIEVFGVGFGFVAMKQGVFETMDRPWFKIEYVKWDDVEFDTNIGEDYSWCINARRNGFKTMLDPTVKLFHHKEIAYEPR